MTRWSLPLLAWFFAAPALAQVSSEEAMKLLQQKEAQVLKTLKLKEKTSPKTLEERTLLNAALIDRLQYDRWQEARRRPRRDKQENNQDKEGSIADAQQFSSEWEHYLKAMQYRERTRLGVDQLDLEIPFDVVVHETIRQEIDGAAYVIEVLTWQAVPGIPMPATIYRPIDGKGPFPTVITPPGAGEDVATHDGITSVQRRMANLALNGMLAFTTEGFFQNGLLKEVSGNRYSYEYFGNVSGAGVSIQTLTVAVWLRVLDYLASRPDTDMSRVGVTGYSNGASITRMLSRISDRVHAIAVVATGIGRLEDRSMYSASRSISVFTKSPFFFYGSHWGSPFTSSPKLNVSAKTFQNRWTKQTLRLALQYGAPRPVYFVMGAQDELYSISDSAHTVGLMERPWRDLGAEHLPSMDVVPGEHNFDATRRSLAIRWLAKILNAEPLLPRLPEGEYETPILPANRLQVKPKGFPGKSFHGLFTEIAAKTMSDRRRTLSLTSMPLEKARTHLRQRLGMDHLKEDVPRPILVDDTTLKKREGDISFQYWIVPYDEYLHTGLLLLAPSDVSASAPIRLYIGGNDLLPPEEAIQQAAKRSERIGFLTAPGFGPAASSQQTIGNLARAQSGSLTLLGMGVAATKRGIDLMERIHPKAAIHLNAEGVDAGLVACFTAALDDRPSTVRIRCGLGSFQRLLDAPSRPVPPPTLFVPGLIAELDIDDLEYLIAPRSIIIESESDLTEYPPPQ